MFPRRLVTRWLEGLPSPEDEGQPLKRIAREPIKAPSRIYSLPFEVDSALALSDDAESAVAASSTHEPARKTAVAPKAKPAQRALQLTTRKTCDDSGYDGSDTASNMHSILQPVSQYIPFHTKLAYLFVTYVLFTYQVTWLRKHARYGSSGRGSGNSGYFERPSGSSSDKKGGSQSSRRNGKRKASGRDDYGASKRGREAPLCTSYCNSGGFLGCPFAKANFGRYRHVHGPCTHPRGFKDIAELKDHLKRYHSSERSYCLMCRQRFGNGSARASNKNLHKHIGKNGCKPKDPSDDEPEWLNSEQEQLLEDDWHQLPGKTPREKWYTIYARLFPGEEIPCACYNFYVPNPDLSSPPLLTILPAGGPLANDPYDSIHTDAQTIIDSLDNAYPAASADSDPYVPQATDPDQPDPWTTFTSPRFCEPPVPGPSTFPGSLYDDRNPQPASNYDSGYGPSNSSHLRPATLKLGNAPSAGKQRDHRFMQDDCHKVDAGFVMSAIANADPLGELDFSWATMGAERDADPLQFGPQPTGDEAVWGLLPDDID